MSPEATLFRIRWSTPADLPALTDVFARAALSNEGDRDALLAHPEALVLEGDGIAVSPPLSLLMASLISKTCSLIRTG